MTVTTAAFAVGTNGLFAIAWTKRRFFPVVTRDMHLGSEHLYCRVEKILFLQMHGSVRLFLRFESDFRTVP